MYIACTLILMMSESDIIIRPAKKDDMVAVVALIQELADFEKMPDGPKINAKVLEQDGFESSPPAFSCLVAELPGNEQSTIVGYALYFPTYSTWQGRSMLLEDLYVSPAHRRRGLGHRLFTAVAAEAVRGGCSRLEFHVLQWNEARAFYERRGALNLTAAETWCYYRLAGAALAAAAAAAAADDGNNV